MSPVHSMVLARYLTPNAFRDADCVVAFTPEESLMPRRAFLRNWLQDVQDSGLKSPRLGVCLRVVAAALANNPFPPTPFLPPPA